MKKIYLILLLVLMFSGAGLKSQTVTFSKKDVSCFGGSDGEITMQVNGGSSVYIYYYYNVIPPVVIDSFGPTTALSHTFLNLRANTYNALVRDTVTGNVLELNTLNILQPAVLGATVTSTNSNCFGASNGTITISNPTGGSLTWQYSINGGSTWQDNGGYTGLGQGTYTVLIRDANATSCVKTLNPGLTLTEPGQLNASVASTNVTCYSKGDGTITISSPSGGSGSYQYSRNGGITWQASGNFTGLAPGTYNVVMRDAAATTCMRTLNGALIIGQPAQLTVNDISIVKGLTCNEGSDGQLRAVVSGGTSPYTYDWYVNNAGFWVTINQYTQTALNLPQGWYEVRVNDANNCGVPTPATAREIFLEGFAGDSIPPAFYFDSASVVNTCQGQTNGSLTLYAHGGKTPYTYSIISGGASGYQASNSFTGLAAGTYETWARDNRGCKKSGTPKTVGTTPNLPVSVSIAANPSGSICPGTSVLFTATPLNGGTSPAYQWRLNGAPVGSNNATYTTSILANGDQVNVILTSSLRCTTGNPATSNTITASVLIPPAITVQPASVAQCQGTNATFSVTATGTGLTYQWRKNGTNISGATNSSYTINNITPADAGNYSVVVTGTCGTVTSNNASLTVNTPPVITVQPVSVTACQGTNVMFSVTANGTGLTYQWRKNGTNISGANGASYTINNIAPADAGNYDVVITGTCGTVTSSTVTLTVSTPPVITVQPASLAQCQGTNATFSVTATGTGLTYQWRKNGTNISGATNSSYTINNITPADAGNYSVVVTGTCGTVTSNNASLTVNTPPVITIQPVSATACQGTNVMFSVTANGIGLTYQWRKNSINIGGATGPSYIINNIVPGDAGNYDVVITGTCGTVTSNTVTLTVSTPPAITVQPVSLVRCTGTSAAFSVTATGTGLTYQWRKNGTNISGATAATYTIPSVATGDAGNYDVIITGTCGTATSNTVTLTVNTPPVITVQPASIVQCQGTNATFSVTATGTGLSYQWRKNGIAVGGATNASYTINNIVPADAGNYDVVITGTCGTVTSNTVTLTVSTPPAITVQPVSLVQCQGTNATFSVTATGAGLTYQWRWNGTNISGATSASYTITSITPANAGNYDVVITGTCGTTTSNTVTLTVNTPPAITVQPVSIVQCQGTNATFSVTATGTGLTYQWRKNGTNISGATNASYTISNIAPADAGNYNVVITGTCGTVTSNTVTLTVSTPPAITVQPVSLVRCTGTSAAFSVTATGTGLTYQWRKNGTNISGATAATYTIPSVATGDAGNYDVVITGTCGTVTSNTVTLTVNTPPVITQQPLSATVCQGTNVLFSVTATGTGLTYQWRKNGTNISGANNTSYTILSVVIGDAGNYDVVITGTCGTVTSNNVTLTVNTPPVITIQPVDIAQCQGTNATFSVTATGTGLTYQWRKNGSNITGATNANYTIINIAPVDAGNYSVVITGTCGTVTSNTVVLTVQIPPSITTQPSSITECEGNNASFSVIASGSGLTYQWRKGGINIGGATSATYTLTNITPASAGNFDVVITGTCGTVTSTSVTLTVATKPVITGQPLGTEVCEGTDVSFSVTATGTGLAYQWRKNGTTMAGRTTSALSLNDVTLSDGAAYDVVIYGLCDTVTSNTAVLTVNPATIIISQDDDTLVCEGSTAEFSVVANGFGAISYQWQWLYAGSWINLSDDAEINGSLTASLTIQNIEASDSGYYRCFVSSGCGAIYSDSIELGVNHIIATIGTPAPFLIDSTTTKINVGVIVSDRFLLFDLGFSLVAPDGTEVWLKGPRSTFVGCEFNPLNKGVNVNFTTELNRNDGDTLNYCLPVKVITGTYAATGNWNVLHGKDPANGAWQIRVYDNDKSAPFDPDGYIRMTSLTFTDQDNTGDTVTINYNSGSINEGILNPIGGELRPTSYILPIRLMTSCWNSEDARALVTVQGGIGPFTYQWTGPTSVPNSNDVMLGAGTYTVTVTDAMGCSTQATVEVSSPLPITFDSFVATDTLNCHGNTDGIIRVKASGGTGLLTYRLLPGNIPSSVADSGVFINLPAGTYTVHVYDISDCPLDSTITIIEPAAFALQNTAIDSLLCSGDTNGVITVTAQGGKLPYTYWITPGTEINNDGIFDTLSQGNYVIRIIDASTCGDTLVTDTIRMNAPSPLAIDSVTVNPILCNGGRASVNIHVSGGSLPYEGSLDGGANFSAGLDFSDLVAGNYTPAVRDINACTVIDTSVISLIDPPVITIDSLGITDVAGCYGDTSGSIYVAASGGWNRIEYSLDGIVYQPGNLFDPVTGGAKTLYIRDSLGCTLIIDTLEVVQPSRLVVSITATHVIGSTPGTITLIASGGTPPYVYSINNGANTQDTGYFDNLVPGLYYAYVQDANGCTFDDTVRIIINELNISITKNDVSCFGLGDGEFIITALDGKSPYWMTGSFLSPDTLTYDLPFFAFTGMAAGSYDFIIEDAEGRTYVDTIEINEPDRIDISGVVTRPTCTTNTNDGAIVLTVTGGSGGFSYLWSDGSTDKDLQNISEGVFNVNVTDASDCEASREFSVTALNSLVADIGNDTTVCLGETVNIIGNVTDYDSISWEVAVPGELNTYTDAALSLVIDATTLVTYTVQKYGCTATDAITINHFPAYGINITDPTNTFVIDTTLYLIAGQQVSLEARADSADFVSYSWAPASGISDPASPSVTCLPENTTLYVVTGITEDGCRETDSLKVVIAQQIQEIFSGFTPNDDGFNDKWVIPHAIEYGEKIEVQVFNRWGEKVFHSKGYGGANEWDGTFNGKPLPIGTYYYIITVDDGKTDPFTGTVTIIR